MAPSGMIRAMARYAGGPGRRSKGDRVVTVTRIPREVWEVVSQGAAERGISISAYLADVACEHAGRPDLISELHKEGLPLAM
jgi:hypothetical protein